MTMFNKLKVLAAAGAVALMPMMASAVTVTSSGVSGSYNCGGPYGLPAAGIDVELGGSFNATFDDGDAGGTYCFDLVNNSATNAVVTLAVASVNQGQSLWGFIGGVTLNGAVNEVIAQGQAWAESFYIEIAANSSVVFDWQFGEAYAVSDNNKPNIDFVVSAVPVPAAGFLLVGALGGLGFVGRRRKKA